MSALNNILGFKGNKNKIPNVNAGNSNLAKAMNIVQMQKGVSKAISDFSPQSRIFGIFIITLTTGLILYSFVQSPTSQIGFMVTISAIILLLSYGLMDTKQTRWAMMIMWMIAVSGWLYYFIKRYNQEKKDEKVGKKSFICNPTGICQNDGWKNIYDGSNPYSYTDPETKKVTNFIPGKEFQNRIPATFSLSFWLNISYDRTIGITTLPVFNKGNLSAYITKEGILEIQLNDQISSNIINYKFPFGQWVFYTISVQNLSAEFYVNGLLEQSYVLRYPVYINKSDNFYVGTNKENPGRGLLPGQMVYLTYINKALNVSEIEEMYFEQMRVLEGVTASVAQSEIVDCNKCPEKCEKKGVDEGSIFDRIKNKIENIENVGNKKIDVSGFDINALIPKELDDYLNKESFMNRTSGLNGWESQYSSLK